MASLCRADVRTSSRSPWRSARQLRDRRRWCCSYGCRTQTEDSWWRSPRTWEEGCAHRAEISQIKKKEKSLDSHETSSHQLLFQVCRTSGSQICRLSACSSKKSNMYLIANGSAEPRWAVLNTVSNRSSTNFCSVPWWWEDQHTGPSV